MGAVVGSYARVGGCPTGCVADVKSLCALGHRAWSRLSSLDKRVSNNSTGVGGAVLRRWFRSPLGAGGLSSVVTPSASPTGAHTMGRSSRHRAQRQPLAMNSRK